jgi:hypothetical protein
VLRGFRRRAPGIDVVRAQDTPADGASDPAILAYAAIDGRVLLTHDRSTVPDFAYARVGQGLPMPGVILVHDWLGVGLAVENLLLVAYCMEPDELADRVIYVPL